ncbi:hypothetical protein Droror1_Dr00005942 [Drosera rotundifolia]
MNFNTQYINIEDNAHQNIRQVTLKLLYYKIGPPHQNLLFIPPRSSLFIPFSSSHISPQHNTTPFLVHHNHLFLTNINGKKQLLILNMFLHTNIPLTPPQILRREPNQTMDVLARRISNHDDER